MLDLEVANSDVVGENFGMTVVLLVVTKEVLLVKVAAVSGVGLLELIGIKIITRKDMILFLVATKEQVVVVSLVIKKYYWSILASPSCRTLAEIAWTFALGNCFGFFLNSEILIIFEVVYHPVIRV